MSMGDPGQFRPPFQLHPQYGNQPHVGVPVPASPSPQKGDDDDGHVEFGAFGATIKGDGQALVRTITGVGNLVLLGALAIWEMGWGRPQTLQMWDNAWAESDAKHIAQIKEQHESHKAEMAEIRRQNEVTIERLTSAFEKAADRMEQQRRFSATPRDRTEVAHP